MPAWGEPRGDSARPPYSGGWGRRSAPRWAVGREGRWAAGGQPTGGAGCRAFRRWPCSGGASACCRRAPCSRAPSCLAWPSPSICSDARRPRPPPAPGCPASPTGYAQERREPRGGDDPPPWAHKRPGTRGRAPPRVRGPCRSAARPNGPPPPRRPPYRPARRESGDQIDCWPVRLAVGQGLPILPLALRGGPTLPLDLEASYTDARVRSRL